ncbi:hypothetical protein LG290_12025 [Halomonas sediminis]
MSFQFNEEYYLAQNPDVAEAVANGTIQSGLSHWENMGFKENRNPNENFNTAEYLEANPDVAAAVQDGMNPLNHFLNLGAAEGRAPNAAYAEIAAGFDSDAYLAANPDVANAIDAGANLNAYKHWVLFGQFEEGRPEATLTDGRSVSEVLAGPSGLTEGLNTLQTAQADVSTFIEETASNELVEEQLAVEPEVATEAQVRTAITAADDAAETALQNDGGLGQGDSLNVLKAKVLDAEEALATAEQKMGEEDGLAAAKESLLNAQVAYEAAIEASDDADVALEAEVAKVEQLNGGTASLDLSVNGAFNGEADKTFVQDSLVNPIIVLGSGNQLVAAEGVNTEANPIKGFDALLAAAQEAYDKSLAEDASKETFEAELADVLDVESPDWKDVTEQANVASDSNVVMVENVTADTLLFNDVDGTYLATADGTNFYSATVSAETGDVTFDSSGTAITDETGYVSVANVQSAVGPFTETAGTTGAEYDTLATNDGGTSYVAYVSGTPAAAYAATVAADGAVSVDTTGSVVDATGFTVVDYVDGTAVGTYTDQNLVEDGAAETSVGLFALADDSGYVVKASDDNFYAADVSDPTTITWNSATTPVDAQLVDTSAAITEITVEADASAMIGNYYNASADTGTDGHNDVEYTADFTAAAPLVADVLAKAVALEAAQAEVTEREELTADYQATQALVSELESLDKAVEDAEKALADEGYVVESIDTANEAGTADSDIFLLTDTDTAITGFELTTDEEAGDSIYVGEQLSIVLAGEDQDISDDLGDVAAQELIVVDNGTSTTLYFEEKSFAGNGSSAADMTVIELTGVTGSEVSINADGFLTVA